MNAEQQRLNEAGNPATPWKKWGPYLSERQWGTVREDYSDDGDAWNYFSHDQARSRAYHWGEDGLAGISDDRQLLCFALAMWNGRDPILKERLFGLTGSEGNHGEDVKESYFYLDSTPTHSYMRALYKYPQTEFPYSRLIEENRRRGLQATEFELADAGVFDDQRYFDVFAEYGKNSPNDILIRITIWNRGPEPAKLHLMPTLWFRNTWSWGPIFDEFTAKPSLALKRDGLVEAEHGELGEYQFAYEKAGEPLFTENETNAMRLFGVQNSSPYVKDAFHEYIVHARKDAVNPNRTGTKFSPCYALEVDAGGSETIRLRLTAKAEAPAEAFTGFDEILNQRKQEADEFYASKIPAGIPEDGLAV